MKTEQQKLKICIKFLESKGYEIQKKAVSINEISQTGYLRINQLLEVVPFSQATIWRLAKIGTFPSPVKLSENVTVWRVSDVQEWLAKRLA
jgi:predicted DNA-binding transcriptional regulator AlpA